MFPEHLRFVCKNCGLPTYRHMGGFLEQGGKVVKRNWQSPGTGRVAGDYSVKRYAEVYERLSDKVFAKVCPGYSGRNLPAGS